MRSLKKTHTINTCYWWAANLALSSLGQWENRILISYTVYKVYKIKSEQLLGEAKLLLLLIPNRNFSPWSS